MNVRPLDSISELVRGVTFEKSTACASPKNGFLPVLRAGNIQDELDLENDLVWIPASLVSAQQLLKVDDIAICLSSGSAKLVGKTASLRTAWRGTVGAFCAIVRPNADVSSDFMAHWFRSAAFRAWLQEQVRGANIQNLRLNQLAKIEIPLPRREDQLRIASRLGEQLALVERARVVAEARLEAAKALETALFRHAFCGITPLSASGSKAPAPSGWAWKRLRDVARLESGHTPSRYHPEWWGGEVSWIALPDIRALDGQVVMKTQERTNAEGIAHSAARVLPTGTVVLSRTASVGFVTILGREMATSQDFVNWVCGPSIRPRFLMHLLRASREYVRSLASGAIHKTVYMPTVRSFEVCVPAPGEQEGIVADLDSKVAASAELVAQARTEMAALSALPAALLRRAFRGGVDES